MGKLILIWIGLPFIIKAFLFIIILYLYLMLCMQLYTRVETIANRIRKWRYKKLSDQYMVMIKRSLEQIESGIEMQDADLIEFIRLLKQRKNSYLLDLWIYYGVLKIREVMASNYTVEDKKQRKKRLVNYFSCQELCRFVYYNRRRYGDLNALIMLGELRDKNAIPSIQEYEKKFYEELNFYFGYNIVLAYAKLGDYEGFIKSYKISNIPNEINDDSLYVHILNSYEGNKEELIDYQIKALKGIKINQCILAIKYFETNKNENIRELILEKLKESINIYSFDRSNVRVLDMSMAAIRYFQVVQSDEADQYMMQLVDSTIWEVRVVVLNYLTKMDKSIVEEMYLEKIKDPNWYIRHNSAKALVKIGTNREKLDRILNGTDQYAKEALEYAMEKREERHELG